MVNKEKYSQYRVEKGPYTMRLAKKSDALEYIKNYEPMDDEVAYFTGTTVQYTQEEVSSFFIKCIDDDSRIDFLVVDKDDKVIAESVLLDLDFTVKSAHFRVAIFKKEYLNQKIGSWLIKNTLEFAFETLSLHRVELEVFSYNTRAHKTYLNLGFKEEGVLRDSILDKDEYKDIILMSMLENEWQKVKEK